MVIPINKQAELAYDEKFRALQKKLLRAKLENGVIKHATRLTKPSECGFCGLPIRPGDTFRDAGYRHRSHETCLKTSQ
jgi:hypothetical protein